MIVHDSATIGHQTGGLGLGKATGDLDNLGRWNTTFRCGKFRRVLGNMRLQCGNLFRRRRVVGDAIEGDGEIS